MNKQNPRKIILEDGSEYLGFGFGSLSEKKLELVFNTSMVAIRKFYLTHPIQTRQLL